jgi:hypothetical protein
VARFRGQRLQKLRAARSGARFRPQRVPEVQVVSWEKISASISPNGR